LPLQKAIGANGNADQRVAHDCQVISACFRNDETLALSIEKFDRQFSFERLDLVADGALRDTELFRGAGETLMPSRGFESFESVQRRKAWAHRVIS
jgi:hypothetical protein